MKIKDKYQVEQRIIIFKLTNPIMSKMKQKY